MQWKFDSGFSVVIITISITFLLIVPGLFQDGMFMDGQQYACVSKNMAEGYGSFWSPKLSPVWNKSGCNDFLEHPPLVFGMQSVFFNIFGNSMYTERIYSLFVTLITLIIIICLWKNLFDKNSTERKFFWMPVLFWSIIPVCFWSAQNNMQENTLSMFTVASVFLSVKGLKKSRLFSQFLYISFSGILIFFSLLSKGIPGLFPLTFILIYSLFYRRISLSRVFIHTLVLISIPFLFFVLIFSVNPEAYKSMSFYFFERLIYRISSEPTETPWYYSLYRLISELLPVIILILLIYTPYIIKKKRPEKVVDNKKWFFIFLLTGLSASLPLMFTGVQKGFYLVPAFPFFAIAASVLTVRSVIKIMGKLNDYKNFSIIIRMFALCLLVTTVSFTFVMAGIPKRDKDMLHDVYLMGNIIPSGSNVLVKDNLYEEWNFQFYLNRYFGIYTDPDFKNQDYFVCLKSSVNSSSDYIKADLPLIRYNLYRKK